jgi:hypothetical protein
MTWDHRNGFSTVLYLVNPSTSASTVTLTFINQLSPTIIQKATMGPAESPLLNLNALVPATVGLQGSLEIIGRDGSGAQTGIVATGLRLNPTNSFTPLRDKGLRQIARKSARAPRPCGAPPRSCRRREKLKYPPFMDTDRVLLDRNDRAIGTLLMRGEDSKIIAAVMEMAPATINGRIRALCRRAGVANRQKLMLLGSSRIRHAFAASPVPPACACRSTFLSRSYPGPKPR